MVEADLSSLQKTTSYEAEIEAIQSISAAFALLDQDAQGRVLCWISSRFAVQPNPDARPPHPNSSGARSPQDQGAGIRALGDSEAFEHPAELFEAARPKTDAERSLVLAYWFQVPQGASSFTSRQVNDELKHIGHGVSNITRALDALIDSRPALVIQLEKSGKTKQAQKKFRVTHEGIKRVQQLLTSAPEER